MSGKRTGERDLGLEREIVRWREICECSKQIDRGTEGGGDKEMSI